MFKNPLDSGRNMFAGATKTQIWARDALPILVQRAQERRTITFKELTNELGLQGGHYNRLMGPVFMHIQTTLAQLEMRDDWEGEIPPVTSIVLKANGECSQNVCALLTGDSQKQPSPKQFQRQLDWIFDYKEWDAVFGVKDISTIGYLSEGELWRFKSPKHALFGMQEGKCNGCQVSFHFRNITIDHIHPCSKGGTDDQDNLQLLCAACNSTKGDRTQAYLIQKLKERGVLRE